ncbi:MAG: hypothetical protein JRN26_05145 [Nitrososphaerota archaeon]|nr:hypothetical protein [Nitrososphaerota archaeon]MDG6928070.1 hypothetical protein [Nitrososphaerota archaeon]MDG6931343.1 hypothetical protein [Nitrososphaerota archaeon]MDG6931674.1 hypothetical protein [Nitrososphaerota archaeon]MDG6936251.1 hypothetical protein [Nitrososphaerota archaeon]
MNKRILSLIGLQFLLSIAMWFFSFGVNFNNERIWLLLLAANVIVFSAIVYILMRGFLVSEK